ncbi:Uncharacterized protein TCM_029885 [Theobroma cacao]|uniref:Uncharacterized protein n=1 Tax=Theobroma cacao TaxID=3641 RepID=A0A061GFD1_THECC|nr:Uncharacterized protein TCM_029885 [Theobroma cacao]
MCLQETTSSVSNLQSSPFYTSSNRAVKVPSSILGSNSCHFFTNPSSPPLFTISVVPVLDQWFRQGRKVEKTELQAMIKQLRKHTRFKDALDVSL